jgi:hypothetical protein
MMQMYKEAVKENDTIDIHAEVEEGWKLLLRKGGDPTRYQDALLKDECAYLIEDTIAEFGMRHRVCRSALLSHVQFFLYRRLYEGDGQDPYYSLAEDVASEDDKEGEDEDGDKGLEDEEELETNKDGDSDIGEEG